ncbi:uncharacterized protein LOC131025723 [Salvia miltiorrhiza]|uniref:uncharacterized protein LOC131025723 n=1 Tax=Salvia miltiorrhiza TaxID=226208 RepID=UPI0025AC0AA5|nr:uncharacterized protein LOC131025723 [Salvia miltiorrhiza]
MQRTKPNQQASGRDKEKVKAIVNGSEEGEGSEHVKEVRTKLRNDPTLSEFLRLMVDGDKLKRKNKVTSTTVQAEDAVFPAVGLGSPSHRLPHFSSLPPPISSPFSAESPPANHGHRRAPLAPLVSLRSLAHTLTGAEGQALALPNSTLPFPRHPDPPNHHRPKPPNHHHAALVSFQKPRSAKPPPSISRFDLREEESGGSGSEAAEVSLEMRARLKPPPIPLSFPSPAAVAVRPPLSF